MAEAQQSQDLRVLELVKAMERTYSIVKSADELKKPFYKILLYKY